MSVLGNQTNATPGDAFFWRIGADIITAREFSSDTVATNTLSTGSITVGGISTVGNITVAGDINALNVTATDTLTSYFANTQYITSYQGANIHGLLLANQIQGSNLVQFPYAILSSISTTSITLDGNTLDTAGQGVGAQLLLNGNPIATASSLTSSILTWSRYPAISNVDMNNFGIGGAGTIQGDTAVFYDGNFENQIVVPTVFATTLNSQQTNTNLISTSALVANSLRANTLQTSTITNAGTLTSQQADVTTINATSITTDSLTTLTGGTVSGTNGTFQNLNVTNSANFSGSRPNFTTGINSSGPNNFNNQSLDNCPNINTQGNTNMTIRSGLGMDVLSPSRIQLICDGGTNIGGYSPVNIIGRGGNRGQVNITGDPGYVSVGAQIQGEVNITANGGGSVTAYATGGVVNITANTGSSPVLGTLTYSAIKLNAAGITSYAGFASPFVAVPGYNLIQGSLGIELIAGSIPTIPNVPGTVYLYGFTGVPQQTGGVRVQNGIGVDFIVPYPQGFNTPPYDLIISGNPAGQKVTLSNVRTLQSDGGVALGFTSMATSNFQASNIIMFGDGTNNGNILGLSGLEQLINFSNVSSLNVQSGLGNFATVVSQRVSTQSLFISTINGLPFSAIVAPTIPSTFTDLTTSTLQANFISTNNLTAFTIANVSSINGFSLAQLVSSVSPQAPAPSTFLQLYTSSFVANTIQTSNISTVSMQAQGITGVSTINGFTIAQFVSSVAPQAPAPSTFTQLFTSSFVANTITGGTPTGLKVTGPGVSIQPNNDYSINLTTTGVGLTTLVTPVQFQVFSPSTVVFGDLRPTTINGLPPVTSIPTNYPQLTVSSLTASNVSTTVLNAGQVLLNGVALGPQVSSFNTLQANNLSTGAITISSINGYTVSQLVNQPVISTFSNIYVSDAAILNQTSLVLNISSINGYNTGQFLSTAGTQQLVSTFNQFFTSSLGANTVSTTTLNASNINATSVVSGTATLSSINGFNINQLVNPALSTVSTFQQLFTSSFVASNIQATNISTISFQGRNLTGVSTINGFTIADFVSSVSPQPPVPSTVNQFFTSSLAVNGITNYQTLDLNLNTSAFMNLRAGVALNLVADQCNVGIQSSNLVENIGGFTTNNTGIDYAVTAGRNIKMNSSNTLSIYNTNTAPAVGSNELFILGEGTTTLAGQGNTNVTAINNLLVNAGQITTIQGGQYIVVNTSQQLQLNGSNEIQATSSNIRLNGALYINGSPYVAGTSNYTNLTTDTLFVNTLSNTSGLLNVRGTNILVSSYTTQIGAVNNIELQANNEIFLQPSRSLQVDTSNVVMNANLSVSKNLNAPAITGLSSINGLPYTPGGGGNTVTSTFTQLYTYQLSNNPTVGSGAMGILAATQIAMAAPTIQTNASQDYLLFASNSYTQSSNTRLQGSNTIVIYNGSLPTVASGDITIQATNNLNLNGTVKVNGQPVVTGVTSTFQQLFTSSLGATLNYLSLTANRSITQNSVSTITNATGAWFSGDITATTFNGLPLPTGGGGTTTSSFQKLYTNTLSNNPVYGNDLNINATVAIHMGNNSGLTSLSLGDSFDVQGATGVTNIYSGNFNTLNDTILFTGRSNITFASPSTLTSNIYVADIFNNPSVGTDINLTATQTIGQSAIAITRNATNTIVDTATGGFTLNAGPGLSNIVAVNTDNTLTSQRDTIITSASNIQFITPTLLWNGAPIGTPAISSFQTVYASTLTNNPALSGNLNIKNTAGNQLSIYQDGNLSGIIIDDAGGVTVSSDNGSVGNLELSSKGTIFINSGTVPGGSLIQLDTDTAGTIAATSGTISLSAYTAPVIGSFTELVAGSTYFTNGQTVSIKNVAPDDITYLYISDSIGNIYYSGGITLAPNDYFTFTLVAFPEGYLQTIAYTETVGVNQIILPNGDAPYTISYYVISDYGPSNPIQVGTLSETTPASGEIILNTSTITLPVATVIQGNQINLQTNLFTAQSSNYFDFYTTNSNAEMYLDVVGNAYLAGISSVQILSSSNINIQAPSVAISNLSSINGVPYTGSGGWTGVATSPLNMDGYIITDATNILTLSTIGTINLNSYASPIIISPTAFAVDQPFPEPGDGRYIYITNTSSTTPWDNVTMVDSHGNTYVSDPFDPTESRSYPVTESITAGYYRLTITSGGDVITTAQINVLGFPLVITAYNLSGPAEFGWGQGASPIAATGQINLNTNIVKFINPSLTNAGLLTIDNNAQLNYSAHKVGFNPGSNGPIPLIQCGEVSLSITENNTLIGGAYTIPISYDSNDYCLQLTYKTTPPYAPDAGIVWSGQASASNAFEISAQGSNVRAGITLDWFWTTIGKYPKGAAV